MQPIIQATYQDGYIHSEKKLNDVSLYEDGRNTFYDIVNGIPEAEHGKMVLLTLYYNDKKYIIDWTKVPDGAKPVRYKQMRRERTMEPDPSDPKMALISEAIFIDSVGFGYQWTDKTVTPWQNRENIKIL